MIQVALFPDWPHALVPLASGVYAACRYCGWSGWPSSAGIVGIASDFALATDTAPPRWWACGLCAWRRFVIGDLRRGVSLQFESRL